MILTMDESIPVILFELGIDLGLQGHRGSVEVEIVIATRQTPTDVSNAVLPYLQSGKLLR